MARDTDPDSGSCQFFIALENLPRLDGKYTIFGEVISGLDVAKKIADLPRDLNDNPLAPVPVKVTLARRAVPERVLSREAGEGSGELLTGPDKPKPFDPADPKWTAPAPRAPLAAAGPAGVRLDLALDETGRVIDVRFADPVTEGAAGVAKKVRAWTFAPATYEELPAKVRIGIDATGKNLGAAAASEVARTPAEGGDSVRPAPRPGVACAVASLVLAAARWSHAGPVEAPAPTQSPRPQSGVVELVEVHEVQVLVTAWPKDGDATRCATLTREDFALDVDGKPTPILSLLPYGETAVEVPVEPARRPPSQRPHARRGCRS